MTDSVLSRKTAHDSALSSRASSLGWSLALVIGFWWMATGVTLAMQQSALAGSISLVAATLLGITGFVLIGVSRHDSTVHAARIAFLGGSLIWWWCSTLFYAGFGIRLEVGGVSGGPRTFALALQAIQATLRADLFGVFAIVAVGWMVRHAKNRLALWTLLAFWCTLQTAKLNVFMGVRNSGADWLPEHLGGLTRFFGPPVDSSLLPVTIAALSLCFATAVRSVQRSETNFQKHARAMIALLLALAVVEHVFLGLDFSLPLWEVFKPRAG